MSSDVQSIQYPGIDPRVRIFRANTGEEIVDAYAIITNRFVTIVDTFALPAHAEAMMLAVQSELAGRRLLVVNTHSDYDHCWGNAPFAQPNGMYPATIIAQEQAIERLDDANNRRYLREKQQQDPRFKAVTLVPPTLSFHDRMTIYGGDLRIQLIATPGHTSDHASVWIPELRLLLAGDAAESPFPYIADAAALGTLFASLQRLADLDPAYVLPSHGGTTDAGLLDRNMAYFATISRHVQDALNADLIPADRENRTDLASIIGYPYDVALRDAQVEASDVPDMYARFHESAVKAAVAGQEANR